MAMLTPNGKLKLLSKCFSKLKCIPSALFLIRRKAIENNDVEIKQYLEVMLEDNCVSFQNGCVETLVECFEKYELPFTEKDIIQNPNYRFEMEQLSGQPLSPCVIINGTMLADISGEEVEAYMLQNSIVGDASKSTSVPLNAPCSDEEHAAMVQVR
jgi:monothiol glutaredoxin